MLDIADWTNALVHEPCIVDKIEREFNHETLVLARNGEWERHAPGLVSIEMQPFEWTGDDVSIAHCMRHLNSIIADGVGQIPFGGGILFIRQPFQGDDDMVWGLYGVVLRCK